MLYTWHFALFTLLFTLYTPALHFTPQTPRSTHYTLHLALRTLHNTLHTLHCTLYTWHSKLYTSHLILDTPHSTLDTPHPALYTLHFTLPTVEFTLHTVQFALQTVHCMLHALHFTVHTLHFTRCTFRLYASHFTLHPRNFTLFTLYTVWNLGLASFSCCARTPTSRPHLRFCTVLLLLALPKVHSDAEGGPWNLPQSITSHPVGFAEFPPPLCAAVRDNHMFSSSSLPTYIASIRRFGRSPYRRAPALDPFVHVDEKAAQLRCALCVFMPSYLPSSLPS